MSETQRKKRMTMFLGDLISAVDSLSADMQNVHVCLYRIDKTKNPVSTTKFAVSLGDDLLG